VNESCLMLHVERLPEGGHLATSEAIQGLVAQGRTVAEILEIARDVARRLLEATEKRRQIFVDQPAQWFAWMTGHPA
jgi:hypothetical protein